MASMQQMRSKMVQKMDFFSVFAAFRGFGTDFLKEASLCDLAFFFCLIMRFCAIFSGFFLPTFFGFFSFDFFLK